jgi:SSS family solute:Na+ symporter
VIVVYFAAVLGLGFLLKQQTNTSEDFFLAGREMSAWVAGVSFLAANMGALELMAWAAASYQYGMTAPLKRPLIIWGCPPAGSLSLTNAMTT